MPSQKQSIILGVAVATILSTSYLSFINFLCCAGMIAAGMVTVWHYTSTHNLTIPAGRGAVMGLIAAGIGSFLAIFLNFALIKLGIRADLAISQFVIDTFGENMPPEALDDMREQMDKPVTFAGYFVNGLIGLVVSAIFGAIGGAIGASVFKKGRDITPDEGVV